MLHLAQTRAFLLHFPLFRNPLSFSLKAQFAVLHLRLGLSESLLLPSLHSSPEKEVIHSAGSFQYHFQRQLPACAACRIIKNCWHFAYKCSPGRTYRNILITPPATVAATGAAAAVAAATTCASFELSLITKKSEFFMPRCTFPASQLQSIYKYFPQLASTSTGWHRALTGLGSQLVLFWLLAWQLQQLRAVAASYLASTSRNMRVIL